MVSFKSIAPILYGKMAYAEFKERIEKLYPKLGIQTMSQVAALFAYEPDAQIASFYRTGVAQRSQIILNLLEAITEKDLNNLIEKIANKEIAP